MISRTAPARRDGWNVPAGRKTGPVIAVASGKGGVGKTWFAVSLAHALARGRARVLLFDGDLGLANVDIQLGIVPERDLGDVVAGRADLDEIASPVRDGGFAVAAGRSGSGGLAHLDDARLAALAGAIRRTASSYDWILLDLGAGLDRSVRTLAAAAGICVVIATDEPTSLTDAYAFVKILTRHHKTADVRIVVNQAASREEGERTYATLRKACKSFLGITPPLLGIVRRDALVADAIRAQTLLSIRHPNAPAAADVETIARRLSEPS